MKNKLQLILAVILLAGCATSTNVWYNPSVTQQQSQTDWNQCEYEASRGAYTPMGAFDSPISSGIQEGFQKVSLMRKCMTSKGYYLTGQETINRSALAPAKYQTLSTYDLDEVSWFNQQGYGAIIGNAFIRKQDGGIVSCAGQSVQLIPRSSYADERMGYLYKSTEYGFNGVESYRDIDQSDPKYAENFSQTVCDVDGRFKFESLPSGSYYIVSTVFWGDPIQGGAHLMKRVSIGNDETKEITISK